MREIFRIQAKTRSFSAPVAYSIFRVAAGFFAM
jgi:hypothetical protein